MGFIWGWELLTHWFVTDFIRKFNAHICVVLLLISKRSKYCFWLEEDFQYNQSSTDAMKPFIHHKYKWLKRVSNPPLLRVLFKTFKIINSRKNSRQTSWETIKIDPRHFQVKWESSRQNSTQIVLFSAIFELYFSSKPNLSFLFSLDFDYIPDFNPDFCMSQKSLRQICKVWN